MPHLVNYYLSQYAMRVCNQASGVLGQPGHISCALGPVHVTGVWFGFSHAAQMPRCSTSMEITDDCIVRKVLPSCLYQTFYFMQGDFKYVFKIGAK